MVRLVDKFLEELAKQPIDPKASTLFNPVNNTPDAVVTADGVTIIPDDQKGGEAPIAFYSLPDAHEVPQVNVGQKELLADAGMALQDGAPAIEFSSRGGKIKKKGDVNFNWPNADVYNAENGEWDKNIRSVRIAKGAIEDYLADLNKGVFKPENPNRTFVKNDQNGFIRKELAR